VLEHVTLTENGKPAFEAWLYAGDSGTFFTAGTTKVIAQRIQMGIHLEGKKKDPALADALGRVSESKDAARPLADVRAATLAGLAAKKAGTAAPETSSKKTASKKTASKKTTSEKTTSEKTTSEKTTSKKKTASKKTASKKTASKKAVAKKTR